MGDKVSQAGTLVQATILCDLGPGRGWELVSLLLSLLALQSVSCPAFTVFLLLC